MTPVLTKIAKLLAKAEGRGTTEAEALAFAAKVQELLQEHNLTLAQVEAAAGGASDAAPRVKDRTGLSAARLWQTSLMAAVAVNNFCLHRVDRSAKRARHLLVGRELNVTSTRRTYEYLVVALLGQLAAAGYVVAVGKRYDRDGTYFLDGAVSRLVERLDERRRASEAESEAARRPAIGNGTHTELVLADVYGSEEDLNNDSLNGFAPGTTAANRRKTEACRAAQVAEHDRLVAEGVDTTVAWYRAYGYPEAEARAAAARWNRRTDGRRGRGTGWTRGDDAHYRKVASPAYEAGRRAGNDVGLDDQVGATARKSLTDGRA